MFDEPNPLPAYSQTHGTKTAQHRFHLHASPHGKSTHIDDPDDDAPPTNNDARPIMTAPHLILTFSPATHTSLPDSPALCALQSPRIHVPVGASSYPIPASSSPIPASSYLVSVASNLYAIMTHLPVPLPSPRRTRSNIPHRPHPCSIFCPVCSPLLSSPCYFRAALCCPSALPSSLCYFFFQRRPRAFGALQVKYPHLARTAN